MKDLLNTLKSEVGWYSGGVEGIVYLLLVVIVVIVLLKVLVGVV